MPPQRLSIIGVGLLGGSIGLALKSVTTDYNIVGYGHRPATLQQALQVGAIDEGYGDLAAAVRGADLVVLCTPVGLFGELIRTMAPHLADGTVVTDVGSTKRSVVRAAEQHLPKGVHFVGSHPMAGSDKRGVEFARADLFRNATCILTPTERTDPSALETVESFWQQLGMRLVRLSPDEHDRRVCEISHLPHAIAAALVALPSDDALLLAGKGFLDTTRIAGGDGALWRDIFLDNRDHLRASIERLKTHLDHLLTHLDANDAVSLKAWLDENAQRRAELMKRKLQEMNPD